MLERERTLALMLINVSVAVLRPEIAAWVRAVSEDRI